MSESLRAVWARLVVIVRAAPTWLTVVALAAPVVAEEIAGVLPTPWSERVTALAVTVAGIATALVQTIRRLTPVPQEERGLLPADPARDRWFNFAADRLRDDDPEEPGGVWPFP